MILRFFIFLAFLTISLSTWAQKPTVAVKAATINAGKPVAVPVATPPATSPPIAKPTVAPTAPVNPSAAPQPNAPESSPAPRIAAPGPAIPGVPQPEEFTEENSGLVLKKNTFTYDSNEGRDPFKIFREVPIFGSGPNPDPKSNEGPKLPNHAEKNIRTALIPNDIKLVGILFRKADSIALISVIGVKGLNRLKINSPIGRNDGKIIEIKRDQVVIEQIKDFDGQKFTEKVTLDVRPKKEEKTKR